MRTHQCPRTSTSSKEPNQVFTFCSPSLLTLAMLNSKESNYNYDCNTSKGQHSMDTFVLNNVSEPTPERNSNDDNGENKPTPKIHSKEKHKPTPDEEEEQWNEKNHNYDCNTGKGHNTKHTKTTGFGGFQQNK
jgi:hypothetical protein